MASSNSYVHRLHIAYDGTAFYGWQKTTEGPSIQESLETAVSLLTKENVLVEGCSRTDRGVHAKEQVASFRTNKALNYKSFQKSLNALLPPSIRVLSLTGEESSFHPGLHAVSKEYNYFVCLGPYQLPHNRLYSWHYPYELDLNLMKQAASFFLGQHDFAAFTNVKKNEEYDSTVRHLMAFDILVLEEKRLQFRLIGNHFLYKMARNLVGTVIYIGRGKIALEDLPTILQKKDRTLAGITAPACGLWLKQINYRDYDAEKRPLLVS